jgi:hypothetical protein
LEKKNQISSRTFAHVDEEERERVIEDIEFFKGEASEKEEVSDDIMNLNPPESTYTIVCVKPDYLMT